LPPGVNGRKSCPYWTPGGWIGSKWCFRQNAEVVLKTVRGIVQSVRAHFDLLWRRCQIRFFLCDFRFAGCYKLKIKMTPDSELLRRFAKTNSEDAFAELVKRHVNLVYSAALRQVNGDGHLAKDVSQMVFTDLACQADSLARRKSLTGWLYTSAHFAAAKTVRGENRRRDREEKFMREPISETAPDADWEKLRPTLDDAMHELKESDREAVLLRYFENRPFAEVGAKLGLNENAARMRVERALEKLRDIFVKRGIKTATAFASVISANAVQIAPANLAAPLTTASIATAGTGTFTLLKIMTATKLKLVVSAIIVAGAATAFVVQHQAQNKLRVENESLRQQITGLQTDNENYSNQLANVGDSKKLPDDSNNELLKLRGDVDVLQRQANEADQKAQIAEQKLATALSAKAQFSKHETATVNNMKQLGLAMRVYAMGNNGQFPTNVESLKAELPPKNFGDYFDFEFVNVGVARSIDNPEHANMLELRERIARQAPDGTWHRIYGLADGSVQIATSYDGNFDAWEKANTTPPPQNPNQ
jgi:RNA polymerase sigma factor (sigma-70 family)